MTRYGAVEFENRGEVIGFRRMVCIEKFIPPIDTLCTQLHV